MKGLGVVPCIVHHMALLATPVVARVLGCDDKLVADATFLNPLADEGLGSLVLTI
jgi:hypothetical protein